jgi:PAS domain S-box-containing protein
MINPENRDENDDEMARLRARIDTLEQAERRLVGENRNLLEEESRLRTILDNVPFALSLKDASGRFRMVNRSFLESVGYDWSEFDGKLPDAFHSGETARNMKWADDEVLSTGRTITEEIDLDEGFRTPGMRQVTKFPVTNAAGEIEGIVSVSINIAEQKKAEQELRRSEEKFRDFAKAASDVLWELDSELRHTYISDRYYELTGRPSGEISGKSRASLPPEQQWESWENHLQILNDHLPFRDYVFPRERADGRTIWFSSSGVPVFDAVGGFEGYRGTLKDITREVEAQQSLRDSAGLLKAIVDYAPLVINLKGLDGRFILANAAFSEVRNLTSEAIVGLTSHDIMPSEVADEVVRQDRKVIATGDMNQYEMTVRRPNGDLVTRSTLKFPVRGADGQIIAIGGFGLDITESKRAEEALRESEERFRAIVDNSPTAILLKDLDGKFQLANKRHVDWFGDPPVRIGKTVHDLLPREMADRITAADRRVVADNTTLEWEHDIGLDDGKQHRLSVTKFPVFDGDGKAIGVGTVLTDVTEERRMQEQLRQAQKMEAVGQLTGGIAHEFNNLLMVIVGNLDLVMEDPNDDRSQKFLAMAMKGAMRGAELTRQLLAFSRKQNLNVERVKSDQLVQGMHDMLQRTLGETIAIETEIETGADAEIWPVLADGGEIEGAVLNLALNASDAMPDGGTITIVTSNQLLDAPRLVDHPGLQPGEYVELAVTDTGYGMSPDILGRVFDPFFTTKDVGEGTGLGLSMVHGFVEQSGGFVEIDSAVGAGTSVRIFLPRADDETGRSTSPPGKMPPGAFNPGATILVVEDDANVREMVVRLMSQLGYATVEAENGVAALDLLAERPDIDILFSDVVLPGGMSGPDLAETAQQQFPKLKIVYTSGYLDGEIPDLSSNGRHSGFVRKPYRKAELAKIFSSVLGA